MRAPASRMPRPRMRPTPAVTPQQGPLRARARRVAARARGAAAAVIVVYPIATLFWNSLHGVDHAQPAGGRVLVGLRELRARVRRRPVLALARGSTILYIVVTVPGALVVGLGLALLANKPFRVQWPVRLGLLLPWALPLVFAGLIFRWFFEYNTGVVNDCAGDARHRAAAMAVEPDARVLARSASRSSGRRRRSWR